MITYSLNFTVYDFVKENKNVSLKECYQEAKKQGKELALYLSFIALISLIFYLPLFFVLNAPDVIEKYTSGVLQKEVAIVMTSCSFAYLFVTNYAFQAFYYKKENENIFITFLNLFKKLDRIGILIAFFVAFIYTIFSTFIILAPLALLFNVYALGVNMLWYTGKKSEEN